VAANVSDTNRKLDLAKSESSRVLVAFAVTGLIFMLLPGTFLGVWNLFAISRQQASESVSASWIQAHGHAQIFGWIGSFIIGIGYYSMAKLRPMRLFGLSTSWTCWALWTTGVGLRWLVNVYLWNWRLMLPFSALLELTGFLIFFIAISQHRSPDGEKKGIQTWMLIVIGGTVGFLATLLLNLGAAIYLSACGESPALPTRIDQRFLVLTTWGFLVPFVWGFSARWLPVLLGLKELRNRGLIVGFGLNCIGIIAALAGSFVVSTIMLVFASVVEVIALRLFESSCNPPKIRGVHSIFPMFVRLAYVWLIAAALLSIWASISSDSNGIWGASRHALTVGFLSTMVFCIGPRMLPAFAGVRELFSTKLMGASLILLGLGCALRVSSEVLAYQHLVNSAWEWLPVSAVMELTAVVVFALNMGCTFMKRPVTKEDFWVQIRAQRN